jgi:hypothetical protein
MQAFRSGTVSARTRSKDTTWLRWCDYCKELAVNPMLEDVADPIPFLQVFAERWRNGSIAPRQNTVRSRTVEGALRAIGQTLASVGAEDIRLTRQGKIHYRIQQQLKGYKCADAPPSRVKPIPFHIIDHTNSVAATCNDPMSLAAADMATIGFFFLLHPGEHTEPSAQSDSSPFWLIDITFQLGATNLPAVTAPLEQLQLAAFVTLTFTTQKNAVLGEVVDHA